MNVTKVTKTIEVINEYSVFLDHQDIKYFVEIVYVNGMLDESRWWEIHENDHIHRIEEPKWWQEDETMMYKNIIKEEELHD